MMFGLQDGDLWSAAWIIFIVCLSALLAAAKYVSACLDKMVSERDED